MKYYEHAEVGGVVVVYHAASIPSGTGTGIENNIYFNTVKKKLMIFLKINVLIILIKSLVRRPINLLATSYRLNPIYRNNIRNNIDQR